MITHSQVTQSNEILKKAILFQLCKNWRIGYQWHPYYRKFRKNSSTVNQIEFICLPDEEDFRFISMLWFI